MPRDPPSGAFNMKFNGTTGKGDSQHASDHDNDAAPLAVAGTPVPLSAAAGTASASATPGAATGTPLVPMVQMDSELEPGPSSVRATPPDSDSASGNNTGSDDEFPVVPVPVSELTQARTDTPCEDSNTGSVNVSTVNINDFSRPLAAPRRSEHVTGSPGPSLQVSAAGGAGLARRSSHSESPDQALLPAGGSSSRSRSNGPRLSGHRMQQSPPGHLSHPFLRMLQQPPDQLHPLQPLPLSMQTLYNARPPRPMARWDPI